MYVFVRGESLCLVYEVFCLVIPQIFYEFIKFNGLLKNTRKFFIAIYRGTQVFTVVYIVWKKLNFRILASMEKLCMIFA